MPQFRLPAATWWAAGERASSDIALAKPACRAPSVAPTCALHALFQACCSTWHSSGGKLHPFGRYFFFAIFILGNFRLTAATTAACSGLPELLANASRAWAASGIGYFLAPFSTKSDFGSFFSLQLLVWPLLMFLLSNGDGGRRRGQLPGSQKRPARTTVCSHSTRDMAAEYSIESESDHKNI